MLKILGLILYRGTICGYTENTPFLYRYFKVLGQKISCQNGSLLLGHIVLGGNSEHGGQMSISPHLP